MHLDMTSWKTFETSLAYLGAIKTHGTLSKLAEHLKEEYKQGVYNIPQWEMDDFLSTLEKYEAGLIQKITEKTSEAVSLVSEIFDIDNQPQRALANFFVDLSAHFDRSKNKDMHGVVKSTMRMYLESIEDDDDDDLQTLI